MGEAPFKNVNGADAHYVLFCGTLVFLMQAGFAMLAAGSVREKNVKNILLKNLLDACMGACFWYWIGYGFAYDADVTATQGNPFIGSGPSNFALSSGAGRDKDGAVNDNGAYYIGWFFQWAFAAAAATIVSGCVAERCQLAAYLVYSACITGFIYPVVVHWVWSGNGFASAFNADAAMFGGVIDFAGSGVVHMTGGFAGLVGAKVLGARTGRWENPEEFEGHSTPLVIIGTFLLWFGWYGFNPGSTLYAYDAGATFARVAVTTTLSAASAGLSGLFIKKLFPKAMGGTGVYDVAHTCNSLLGGLVGITAGCSVVTPNVAFWIGVISALIYHGASCLMRKIKIDDPLDAFAVHGACGVWGVLAVGLFAVKEWSYAPHSDSPYGSAGYDAGIFYGADTRGTLFAAQVCVLLVEIPWVMTTSFILFFTLHKLGLLRVPLDQEQPGLDVSKHGGSAYPEQNKPPTKAEYPGAGQA